MNAVDDEDDRACASCGVAEEVDNTIQSEECYDHDDEEFNKRADELRDRKLFTQPKGTHHGDCPLCFLPLPLDPLHYYSCCSETICQGCLYANTMSNIHDEAKAKRCPFCREPLNDDENHKRMMKRVKADDPKALLQMGRKRYRQGDYDTAFEYYTKAAELGNAGAHSQLGLMYKKGEGVEKDDEKRVYHYEKAAIEGHPHCRHILAVIEEENGNIERAAKHFIIAANLGLKESMKELWGHYSQGNITKEDLAATLRTHQAAIDATKSAQRDAAEVAFSARQNRS